MSSQPTINDGSFAGADGGPRPGSSEGGPRVLTDPVHRFHRLVDDPKADIILRSSDKISFALQRAPLIAASTVFADMFALPRARRIEHPDSAAPSSSVSDQRASLEIVDLVEKGESLARLLRHVYPAFFLEDGRPSSFVQPKSGVMSFLWVDDFLSAAEKYDMPVILHTVSRAALPELLERRRNPIRSWCLACRFGHLDLARTALRQMTTIRVTDGKDGTHTAPTVVRRTDNDIQTNPRMREMNLGDLPEDEIAKLPMRLVRQFARLQSRVAVGSRTGNYPWAMAADEFSF